MPDTHTPLPKYESGETLSQVAARNLQVAMELRRTAWQLTEAGVRTFRPHLDDSAVQNEVRAQFRRATG